MKNKDKILLVSPFVWDENLYPHLYEFKVDIEKHNNIIYFYFPERGYWIERLFSNLKSNKFSKKGYRPFYNIIKAIFALQKIKKQHKIDRIVAIDNFIYIICCFLFGSKNVILWSHDFVAKDNKSREGLAQKMIRNKTKKYLKDSLLVIQTEERRRFFVRSLEMDKDNLKVFYLPVCLNKIQDLLILKTIKRDKPNVVQIGGINESRSNSVTLLENFDASKANFLVHGFISNEFSNALKKSHFQPIVSDKVLSVVELPLYINENCDIGLVSYNSSDENFYNIACSSGQFAEFIRLYKPIISFGDNTLTDFITNKNLGIGIKDITELNDAIQKITLNYQFYVENIIVFLNSEFDLNNYADNFCKILKTKEYDF